MPGMRSLLLTLAVGVVLAGGTIRGAEPPALVKARNLYNAGDYDGAIAAAIEAQRQPDAANAAALVNARAHLERYRQRSEPADLATGRQLLTQVRADALLPRDQVDLFVGQGQCLFLSDTFGAAAELFDTALAQGFLLTRKERLQLLDWWANALDRSAQVRPADKRGPLFERVLRRMEDELRRDPENPVANYWLAAAARGTGDVERAWDAAIAAWVRARQVTDGGDLLRTDLDRLMADAIIPERGRLRKDALDAARVMRDEWNLIKEQWK